MTTSDKILLGCMAFIAGSIFLGIAQKPTAEKAAEIEQARKDSDADMVVNNTTFVRFGDSDLCMAYLHKDESFPNTSSNMFATVSCSAVPEDELHIGRKKAEK